MGSVDNRSAFGRRLMPAVLDELARSNSDRLYAAIPRTADVSDGFRDVTVAEMARGVDLMANWIIDRYGRSDRFETISYIGTPDLRGAVVFQAVVKAGYKLLLPSPRNPPAVNISLMHQTGSTKLLHAAEVAPVVQQLQALNPGITADVVPSFDEMLSGSGSSEPRHIPFSKDFETCCNDPVVVLHSSGSTGLPKPITMTHGSFAVLDNEHNLSQVPGRKKRDWSMWTFDGEARVYTIFPFFHLAGFLSLTLQTIFMNASPVLGPPHLIPDGPLLKSVMLHQKLRSIFLPPAVIEQLLHEPNGIDFFRGLDFLTYSGAPFNPESGEKLSKVVELVSPFGSTEIYPQPELAPASREDWAWHEFNPAVRHEMRLYDDKEGTYELVIPVDEKHKATTAAYHNLPRGTTEYPTKDLFTRHPDPAKPNLYKYYGRRDDIIVLANGEKFNPVPAEVNVAAHARLKGAFMIGNGRTQAMLLVEPKEPLADPADRVKLVEEIWPLVEKSNALIAGQGRVHRRLILCASSDKPFTRTGKGTIVRKLTQEAYREEIDQVYNTSATTFSGAASIVGLNPTVKTTSTYELPAVVQFVRTVLAGSSFPQAQRISETEDFFAHGLDSIQTLEIVRNLKQNLGATLSQDKSVSWISPRTIFKHSNIAELARLIQGFLNDDEGDQTLNKDQGPRLPQPVCGSESDRIRAINNAVEKYTRDLPEKTRAEHSSPAAAAAGAAENIDKSKNNNKDASTVTVALLGSTGYLGTHLLARLVQNPRVGRVYCLNRSRDAQERQRVSLAGLLPAAKTGPDDASSSSSSSSVADKLRYVTVDMSRPRLGLQDEHDTVTTTTYVELCREVDVYVYNAWRLDFGISLRSFDPFLRAARDLVDMSLSREGRGGGGPSSARIVFVSSLSSVGAMAATSAAPETPVEDPLASFDMGYAESKLVAERILNAASNKAGVPVSIVRVGQVGGPSSPSSSSSLSWADQAWISAIARTARTLGTIPTRVAPIDWVPVDTAAAVLHDVALIPSRPAGEFSDGDDAVSAQVYHVVHRDPQPWDLLVRIISKRLGANNAASLKQVSLPEWVQSLRDILDRDAAADGSAGSAAAKEMPALKMVDYYESLGQGAEGARWENSRVAGVSDVEYPPLDEELLGQWLQSWEF